MMVAFAPTTTLIGSSSRDPIGFRDGLNLFQFCDSSPSVNLDPSGYGCHLCTFLESVEEIKDESGNVIACGLVYGVTDKSEPHQYNGGFPDRCKGCQPVADCSDIPGLDKKKFTKLAQPKWKGIPFFKTAYCPQKSEWPEKECFGIIAKDCASDFLEEFKNCSDLCNKGGYAEHLCKGLPFPLNKACEALVSQSKELCIYYCENKRIRLDE